MGHLGVEVESPAAVDAESARLQVEGLVPAPESGTCCFARQEKVWLTGPDGLAWEIYTVLEDVPPAPAEVTATTGCCC